MTGKLQLAAKVLLGTTLMGSGTGGVYYATTHGWTSPAANKQAATPSATELDAVTDAWSQPATKLTAATDDSSPVARSAAATAAATKTPATAAPAKPAVADRYAVAAEPAAPAEVAKVEPVAKEEKPEAKPAEKPADKQVAKADDAKTDEQPKAAEPKVAEAKVAEPTPVVADDFKAVSLASDTTDNKPVKTDAGREPTPAGLPAIAEPIARGQEPRDTPVAIPAKDMSADISGAFDSAPPAAAPSAAMKEPKALTPSTQQNSIPAPTQQRAQQAFGAPTAPAGPNDRYGSGGLAPPPSDAGMKPVSSPFGAQPLAAPPSGGTNDRLAPLPTSSGDIGAPLRDMQSTNDGMRPLDANLASPRTGSRDTGMKPRMPQAAPYNSASGAGDSYSPSRGMSPAAMSGTTGPPMLGDGSGKPGEKALEGPQQPTLVIQKFAPGEIQVGKPAKFVLQVRNSGNQVADNVTINDEVPQGTQLVSTSPAASNQGSRLTWQIGKLSPGEDRTIEMQVMPKSEGDIGSVATVTYSAQASVRTRCTMPQLAIRMTAPSEVMVGKQQHVKIELRNPGTGDAAGVMLFETVPPNVKHAAGPTLEFEIGTLRAGETRELDLVLNAEKPGKVVNVLTAKAQGSLQVQQQVEFEVIAPALSVAVQGPERRYLERPATYEVSVQNPGTASAHDVQIVTKLSKGLRFVKANNMGEYDATSHAVYWSLAELPKGEKGTVELTAVPIETGPQTLQVESHAQSGLADKTQRDVLVEGLANIKFDVKALNDPIEVGAETGYEIRVVNQGTKAATNVRIVADLPSGLKLTSAEGETAHKLDQNRVVFEPLQSLAPKADTVYRLRVQGLQVGDQRVAVEVKTDDLQQPIRHEESTRVFGDQ